MYTFVLLASLIPSQFEHPTTYIIPRIEIGDRPQTRKNFVRRMFNKLSIKGNNNVVIVNYRPTDQSINYNNKQKWVNRRPLFRRFRRTYP